MIEALIARYWAERAAWRAVLRIVPALTVADVLAQAPTAGEALHVPLPPEPPPEVGETVMELLWRELGAVPIPAR